MPPISPQWQKAVFSTVIWDQLGYYRRAESAIDRALGACSPNSWRQAHTLLLATDIHIKQGGPPHWRKAANYCDHAAREIAAFAPTSIFYVRRVSLEARLLILQTSLGIKGYLPPQRPRDKKAMPFRSMFALFTENLAANTRRTRRTSLSHLDKRWASLWLDQRGFKGYRTSSTA